MDLTVATVHPSRQPTCPACAYQRAEGWLPDDDPAVDHSCRSRPSVPRDTLAAQARADRQAIAARESEVRKGRLRDIRMRRGYR